MLRVLHCGDCQYFKEVNLYNDCFCLHPSLKDEYVTFGYRNYEVRGKYLGQTDRTPKECPLLKG